jgi:hypothetical protein
MVAWFDQVVLGGIRELMRAARSNYGVDPVVFIIVYLGSAPFFYFSIYRMVRALARKHANQIMLWSTVFLFATAAPFLYVLFFGRNFPWWVYGVIGVLIGQGVFFLVRRLTKKDKPPRRELTVLYNGTEATPPAGAYSVAGGATVKVPKSKAG